MKHLKAFKGYLLESSSFTYEVKEGCNVVYHGGKFLNNDPKWLIQEQGGIYCTKSLSGAELWGFHGGVISRREWTSISNSITSRVYEFTIRPGSKMVNLPAGGLDLSSKGGLKDVKRDYFKNGVIGLSSQRVMDRPTGSIGAESALEAEIILFESEGDVSCRVVPFAEVLEHYRKFDLGGQYQNLMPWYKTIRRIIWSGCKRDLLDDSGVHIFDKERIDSSDWGKVSNFYRTSGDLWYGEDWRDMDKDRVDSVIEKLANTFHVYYSHGLRNMSSLDEVLNLVGLKKPNFGR